MATNPFEYNELSPLEDPDLSEDERELGYQLATLRHVAPSAEFRNQLRARLQMRMQHVQQVEYTNGHKPIVPLRKPLHMPRVTMRFAALVTVILIMVTVLSTSYATAHSLPGQKLYFVKRSIEQVQVSFAPPEQRSSLRLNLTERRLGELEHLVTHKADETQVIAAVEEYKKSVQETVDTVDPEHAQKAEDALGNQTSKITNLVEKVPTSTQHALVEAQESNEEARQKARSRVPTSPTATSDNSNTPFVEPTNTPWTTQRTTVTLPLIISSSRDSVPEILQETASEPLKNATTTVASAKQSPMPQSELAQQESRPSAISPQATDSIARKKSPTPLKSNIPTVDIVKQTHTPAKSTKTTTMVQSATSGTTATRKPSPTNSATATMQPSPTNSATATMQPSSTNSATTTMQPSPTNSATATMQPSPTNAPTHTPALSQTPTSVKMPILIGLPVTTTTILLSTPVMIDTPTISVTPVLTETPTLTATPALTNTSVISTTPSVIETPQATAIGHPNINISPTLEPTMGHMEPPVEPTESNEEPPVEPTESNEEPPVEPTESNEEPPVEPTESNEDPTPTSIAPLVEPSRVPEATITPQLAPPPDMTDTPEITNTPGLVVTPEATHALDTNTSPEQHETPVLVATPEVTTTKEHILDPSLSEPQDSQGGASGTIRSYSNDQSVPTPNAQTGSPDDAQTNSVSPETEQHHASNMVSESTTSVYSANDVLTSADK